MLEVTPARERASMADEKLGVVTVYLKYGSHMDYFTDRIRITPAHHFAHLVVPEILSPILVSHQSFAVFVHFDSIIHVRCAFCFS